MAPSKAAHKSFEDADRAMAVACKANAVIKARISPIRLATRSQRKTAGMAAMPIRHQIQGPMPASSSVRSTIATVNVALITNPHPAAK